MKILKARLINFQKHTDTPVNFSPDLNVITGKSDSGKTALKRSIHWVLFNAPIAEKDYRRWGTKETTVTLWLDNGFEVERTRTDTLNRYILRKEGCTDLIFDAVGKEIPEAVRKVIEVGLLEIDETKLNLNIAEQQGFPFLLDCPPSFRAKLFNKLTGNELLDKIFSFLNKEKLRIQKDIKSKEELSISQESQRAECEKEYTPLKEKQESASVLLAKIQEQDIYVEALKKVFKKQTELSQKLKDIQEKENSISLVSDSTLQTLRAKAERLEQLQKIQINLTAVTERCYTLSEALENCVLVNVDFDVLKKKADSIQKMKELSEKHILISDRISRIMTDLEKSKELLISEDLKIKELKSQLKVCETCGQIICEENHG